MQDTVNSVNNDNSMHKGKGLSTLNLCHLKTLNL